jgi:hypothetical protein
MYNTIKGSILGWISYLITFAGSLAVIIGRHDVLAEESKLNLGFGVAIVIMIIGIIAIKVLINKVRLMTNKKVKTTIIYGISLLGLWYIFKMFRAIEDSVSQLSISVIWIMGVVLIGYVFSLLAAIVDKK